MHPHISKLNQNTKIRTQVETQGVAEIQRKPMMQGDSCKCNCGGSSCIGIGWWGGAGGNHWSYKPTDGAIVQIIIVYGGAINSIMFKTQKPDGSVEYSPRFGGNGGDHTTKIDIDYPSEYLLELNGTGGWAFHICGPHVLRALWFKTNVATYGPIGCPGVAGSGFWCPINNGAIVGFWGHCGDFVNNIGVYAKPVCTLCDTKPLQIEAPNKDEVVVPNDGMKMVVARSPGAWGGCGGKQWDDGVFARLKQIVVNFTDSGNDVIHAVQFQYENRDGKSVWSQMHGGLGSTATKRIKLDCDREEFLVGISGYFGPIEGPNGVTEVVRSLSFHTSRSRYGPFGIETGTNYTHFSSSSNAGTVVGFHGRSDGVFLNSIGVHMEYK